MMPPEVPPALPPALPPLDFPATSPYFAGHFPDRPILPGISGLWLAIEALARATDTAAGVCALSSARLKRLVGPGDRIDIGARGTAPGRWRLELTHGEERVAQADVTLGTPQPLEAAPMPAIVGAPPALPALDLLMPHRPPMRFPTRVIACADDGLAAEAIIPADCPLVRDGRAPAIACVEAAAQAAALWEGVRRFTEAATAADAPVGPRIGYLVALRDLAFGLATVAADATFEVAVRLDAVALPLTHYRIEVRVDGTIVATGRVATVLADATG